MAGFGTTIRTVASLGISPLIAAFVTRVIGPMVDMMESSPIVEESGTPEPIARTITFVDAASSNFLLAMIVSAIVLWLTMSYLNSEVRV